MKRVVVTGLGVLSSIGNNVLENWHNLSNGQSGITHIDGFEHLSVQIAGQVKNFSLNNLLPLKEERRFDQFVLYALKTANDAILDSKLELDKEDLTRIGVIVGSGIGGLQNIETNCNALYNQGSKKVSPFFVPGAILNMATSLISIHYGFQGPAFALSTACATGNHSIGEAFNKIQTGHADIMIAGSAESVVCNLGLAGFAAMRALSTRNAEPAKASRPWDKDRDGFVLSEGSGILVLEELERAQKRGAHIYAELTGYGLSADAYHISAPDPQAFGASLSMKNALATAKLQPQEIDYINAHGTSTNLGDISEVNAIKKVFGDYAHKLSVSSTKSMTGHALGAAGSIEAVFSILALQNNLVPPTINLDNIEDGIDLDLTPNIAKQKELNNVLSNSFAFGGLNSTLIFSKLK
jgi:3-oxoacyl-[acyl-carrier-protein] synthase II